MSKSRVPPAVNPNKSVYNIDSLMVAQQLEVPHNRILDIIRDEISEISIGQTVATATVLFIEGVYLNKQGKEQPKYFVSEKGLVLILLRYPDKKRMAMLLMDRMEKLQLEIIAKDKLLLENKLKEQESSIKRLTVPQIGSVVKTEYGSKWKPQIKLSEKEIQTYRVAENGIKIPDGKKTCSSLSGEQLWIAMVDKAEAQVVGRVEAAKRTELGLLEYKKWKAGIVKQCPKPSDFGLQSEYEGFFEDLSLPKVNQKACRLQSEDEWVLKKSVVALATRTAGPKPAKAAAITLGMAASRNAVFAPLILQIRSPLLFVQAQQWSSHRAIFFLSPLP
jgi:phage regulator Rha-like protein